MFLTHDKIVGADEDAVISLSKQIRLNLPKDSSIEARVERIASIRAHHLVQDAIKKHGGYVDSEGKKASSLGGLNIQINKKIKKAFGVSVGELFSIEDIKVLRIIREAIAAQFHKCELLRLSRVEIKERVYAIIQITYDIFSLKMGQT
jgi:hypothetical protein